MAMAVIAASLAAGTAVSTIGAVNQGRSAQDQADFNARVARNEATAIRQKTRFDQVRQASEASRIKGASATRAAKSGARTDIGAPVLAAAEQASELELDNLLIGFEGERMAQKRMSGALISEFGGASARQASKLTAGSTLLQGFGSAAAMFTGGGGKPGTTSKAKGSGARAFGNKTR